MSQQRKDNILRKATVDTETCQVEKKQKNLKRDVCGGSYPSRSQLSKVRSLSQLGLRFFCKDGLSSPQRASTFLS